MTTTTYEHYNNFIMLVQKSTNTLIFKTSRCGLKHVFSLQMLILQLQMVLGGKTLELSETDYAIAAFLIYTSILDIFLKLVQIIGFCQN